MSRPQHKSVTMFYTEGNPSAVLVTNQGDRLTRRHSRFKSAQAALAWCIVQRAKFVYLPTADVCHN